MTSYERPILRRTRPDHIIRHDHRTLFQKSQVLTDLEIIDIERLDVIQKQHITCRDLALRLQPAQRHLRGSHDDGHEITQTRKSDELFRNRRELCAHLETPDMDLLARALNRVAHMVREQDGRVPKVPAQLDQYRRSLFGDEGSENACFVWPDADEEIPLVGEVIHRLEDLERIPSHLIVGWVRPDEREKRLLAAVMGLGKVSPYAFERLIEWNKLTSIPVSNGLRRVGYFAINASSSAESAITTIS